MGHPSPDSPFRLRSIHVLGRVGLTCIVLVMLGTFTQSVHWANLSFASATVPINIVVPPDTSNVPEPTTLALLGIAALGGVMRRKAK